MTLRVLLKSIVALVTAAALAQAARMMILHKWESDLRSMIPIAFARQAPFLKRVDLLEIRVLDFTRGDFQLTWRQPPFEPVSWTFNRHTGELIPWGYIPPGVGS